MDLPLAKLLEGGPDDGPGADDAVSTDPNVGQVPADDGLVLNDVFAVQHDVLGAAQHRQAAHSVSGRLEQVKLIVDHGRQYLGSAL